MSPGSIELRRTRSHPLRRRRQHHRHPALTCEITTADGTVDREPSGFDGFIFTNDLDYVPEESATDPSPCDDDDAAFTAGCSGTNWPSPTPPDVDGRCRWLRQPPGTDCGAACPQGTTPCICNDATPPICIDN